MNEAIRLLATYDWPEPIAGEGLRFLSAYGRRLSVDTLRAVRENWLTDLGRDDWSEHAAALRNLFRVHRDHCFHVSPLGWLSLTETQVTGGLARFLHADSKATRNARIAALFAALGVPVRVDATDRTGAAAEVMVGRHRIDLVAYVAKPNGQDVMIVIEGKLEHGVTAMQLRRYEEAVAAVADHFHLVVGYQAVPLALVGAGDRDRGRRVALRRRPRWRFSTWRALVHGLEQRLDGADDADFRRYRRTLWERSA